MDMDGEILVLARGASRLLRARPATLAASDVGMSSIPDIQTDEVEFLACRTAIAVAFGKIGETVGTVERVVLAESTVPVLVTHGSSSKAAFSVPWNVAKSHPPIDAVTTQECGFCRALTTLAQRG